MIYLFTLDSHEAFGPFTNDDQAHDWAAAHTDIIRSYGLDVWSRAKRYYTNARVPLDFLNYQPSGMALILAAALNAHEILDANPHISRAARNRMRAMMNLPSPQVWTDYQNFEDILIDQMSQVEEPKH